MGLTEYIENSARKHIPDDPQQLLQRITHAQPYFNLQCDLATS